MKIKLLTLHITNFKGIKDLTVEFNDETSIYGDNATGKTTVFDAFTWLLFGKDSSERKDFNIKTLDKQNQPIHYLDHEVSGVIDVDGSHITLKRVFREKWVKKRGEETPQFSGHETVFFWNDVPCNESEYKSKVNGLIEENIFKLITSTTYFNVVLKWQERRKILLDLAGRIDPEIILSQLESEGIDVTGLRQALLQGKTPEEYKKEVSAKKKKIAEELKAIPSRLDEVQRSLPEEQDWARLDAEKADVSSQLQQLEQSLSDALKVNEEYNRLRVEHNNKVFNLNQKRTELERNFWSQQRNLKEKREQILLAGKRNKQNQLNELAGEVGAIKNAMQRVKSAMDKDALDIEHYTAQIDATEKRIASLRTQWVEVNSKTVEVAISEHETNCPTCGQHLPHEHIEQLQHKASITANTAKVTQLNTITADANRYKAQLELYRKELETASSHLQSERIQLQKYEAKSIEIKSQILALELKEEVIDEVALTNLDAEISNMDLESLISPLTEQIRQLEATKPEADQSIDKQLDVLKEKRRILSEKSFMLAGELAKKTVRQQSIDRYNELLKQEKTMAQEVASLEREEYAILKYNKGLMEQMELSINRKFYLVTFKLFAEQINGGETETCETLVDGVPYSDLNTASRINAGLDIINGLSNHYDAYAPVFIDNRESVVRIIETDSQVVNLIVSEQDKKLRVA